MQNEMVTRVGLAYVTAIAVVGAVVMALPLISG